MKKKSLITIGLYSLGCTKNLVDSEVLLGDLLQSGQFALSPPFMAEIILINTCGFLEAAKSEAIETIQQAGQFKQKEMGSCKAVIVIGCLAERHREKIKEWAPQTDYVIPLSQYHLLPPLLQKLAKKFRKGSHQKVEVRTKQMVFPEVARYRLTPQHYAYLRVSEGCNHQCTFCVIPQIRGKHRSKPLDHLVEEAREMVADGAVELNLIADDTTFYGMDLSGTTRLPHLLEGLNEIEKLRWIRMFYAYPTTITDETLIAIRDLDKVVPYLDMPIQHISDSILQAMKRGTGGRIRELVKKFRDTVEGIVLRTTVIVGFPGEGEQEFQELVQFIEETRFDHLGIFMYSPEKGAPSSEYDNQVSEEEKIRRYDFLAGVQTKIVHQINQNRVGNEETVLIDGLEGSDFFGRTAGDGPEVDDLVWIKNPANPPTIGSFAQVKIESAQDFDLVGTLVRE